MSSVNHKSVWLSLLRLEHHVFDSLFNFLSYKLFMRIISETSILENRDFGVFGCSSFMHVIASQGRPLFACFSVILFLLLSNFCCGNY